VGAVDVAARDSRTSPMRNLLCLLLLAPLGCAHTPPAPAHLAPKSHDTPELTVNPPPQTLYRYVGRVRGVARTTDLVSAARAANDDLRWKAHALGADLVHIDYVAVPPEHARPMRRVLLSGRAYKAIHP
jgi:hypothetical protein